MRLDRYSAIQFNDLDLSTLAPAICAWIVPDDSTARSRRQKAGVPATWTASSLLATDDFLGNDGCSVRTRGAPDGSEFLLRFTHRDDTPGILWTIMFRLSHVHGGTLLEAAVAREAPRGVPLEPKASAPRIVMDLIRRYESSVRPRELVYPPANATTLDDVETVVDQLLLSPDRRVPVVLVARDVYGSGFAVDLNVIASRMRGIAIVVSLDGMDATMAFESALKTRGLSLDLRCFNGAVHSYGNAANLEADHRLWLRRSVETLSEEFRSEYVGETLARHLSLACAPPGFLFAIEDFDRRERMKMRTLDRVVGPGAGDEVNLSDVQRLRVDLDAAEKLLSESQTQAITAEDARRAADRQREMAEQEAATERMIRESLQEKWDRRRASDAERMIGDDLLAGLRAAVATAAPSPKQALQVLEVLFSDRVVILPEALESAEIEGARFRDHGEVFSLLVRLCTKYYDSLCRGGDAMAKQAFTEYEFAPRGSNGEMKSRACIRDRTRTYRGRPLVMWAHLRAGGKGAAETCLRIHFAWAPDEQKIVVGHCGAHLNEA